MSAVLDPSIADRLAKLCGLFSSDHDGERASAAAMADKLVRGAGLTWFDVFAPGGDPRNNKPTVDDMIAFCLAHDFFLNVWESGFVRGVRGRQFLTKPQLRKLHELYHQVEQRVRAAA